MDLVHTILATFAAVAVVAIVGSFTADSVYSLLKKAADFLDQKAHPRVQHQDFQHSRPMN